MTTLINKMKEFLQDRQNQTLSLSILKTTDSQMILEELQQFCQRYFDSCITDLLLLEFSVGAGFGLRLQNGQAIFLKAFPPDQHSDEMEAICEVQKVLFKSGFPCPEPLLFPQAIFHSFCVVQSYVVTGDYEDTRHPEIRKLMAETLASLHRLTANLAVPAHLPRKTLPTDRLWIRPHNDLFNFEVTGSGVEWIDDQAKTAREIIADAPKGKLLISHIDWRAEHFRFLDSQVSVIYDWDALFRIDEWFVLGFASSIFTVNWNISPTVFPKPEEARGFVDDYAKAMGVTFSVPELKAISAYGAYILSYVARCHHAVNAAIFAESDICRVAQNISSGQLFRV